MKTLLACALALGCAHGLPPREASDGRYAMGTALEIRLQLADARDPAPLFERLFAEAARLERIYSRFDPASDVSRLNARAGAGPQPVPRELARLLAEAREYAALSDGSFDVTVGPLVELWTDAARRGRLPEPDELARARARVGWQRVHADPDARSAALEAGVAVDLGGIAKGAALDDLVQLARKAGARSALFSFGGSSLHALGAPSGEPGWRVLLRDASGGFAGVATLRDCALSVSSSTGQSVEIQGRRYGHLIDPRSGAPLVRERLAAVLAPSGAQAEALSKALLILDRERALALLERLDAVEGVLLEADGRRYATRGWTEATQFEPHRAIGGAAE